MANHSKYSSKEEELANTLPRNVIMGKPNVVMAYAGTKKVNGKDTGEPCIVVGVSKKIKNLPKESLVPKEINGEVITDVIEVPKIYSYSYLQKLKREKDGRS